MNFSALGYFFAKAMYEKNNIPVGLINSSWGGTPVEAWISEEGLKEFPKYINDKRQYEDDAYLKSIKQTEGLSFYRWNTSLYREMQDCTKQHLGMPPTTMIKTGRPLIYSLPTGEPTV